MRWKLHTDAPKDETIAKEILHGSKIEDSGLDRNLKCFDNCGGWLLGLQHWSSLR